MSTTPYVKMQPDEADFDDLMKTLIDNFYVLADEVQHLSDRKTILEHKLRFAHEQYQYLADKYAPADPEISKTVAKLQLPPELQVQTPDRATFVPLPSRRPRGSKQQTAEAVRDGRRASQRISALRGWKTSSEIGGRSGTQSISESTDSVMRTSRLGTTATTVLEHDFTVPGKKSQLLCPFSKMSTVLSPSTDFPQLTPNLANPSLGSKDNTPHQSNDPICAALYAETHSSPPPSVTGSAAKCPIRYLDQHSPEEVARYFETHKHEIPRSHEVCVKRYQRNEEDIRKLDAKYGNLVSMISGLGQKHQPMLPVKEDERVAFDDSKHTNSRVENWAKAVSSDGAEHNYSTVDHPEVVDANDREARFDRPMKEVRLGESPSRPWGIPVPYVEPHEPDIERSYEPQTKTSPANQPAKPSGTCPFGHGQKSKEPAAPPPEVKSEEQPRPQLTFLQPQDASKSTGAGPQMVFTGPVFIGYPVEQAMALMQLWQAGAVASAQK